MTKRLIRDRLASDTTGVVESREEYLELLKDLTLGNLVDLVQLKESKDRTELYLKIAEFDEAYHTLRTQLLTATTETATIARHTAQHQVAKELAETQGGFFNGITEES